MDDDIDEWLQKQPLDEPLEIDGERFYLNVHQGGAELGAYLIDEFVPEQLQDALRLGFRSAIHFDAGLGVSADGSSLVLTQWLPEVSNWSEAAQPLENLLNQLSMWRAALAPERPQPANSAGNRDEQRLRMLFAGVK